MCLKEISDLRVLFVSSGNAPTKNGLGSIVYNQGQSIKNLVAQIDYFPIVGKGAKGYISNIFKLKKHLKTHKYDVIHAHYSLSAYVASLAAGKIPLVVSLMGTDIQLTGFPLKVLGYFVKNRFAFTIVKSQYMIDYLGFPGLNVLPNGVDFDLVRPIDRIEACQKVGFDPEQINVLFPASPKRAQKNFPLAQQAMQLLDNKDAQLQVVYHKDHKIMPYYFNAANVLLMTSRYEGSPNVVKEAMACNIPIVTTKVGDVETVLKDTPGCYVVESNPQAVAEGLRKALAFNKRTNGREVVSWLDSRNIAKKLTGFYQQVVSR